MYGTEAADDLARAVTVARVALRRAEEIDAPGGPLGVAQGNAERWAHADDRSVIGRVVRFARTVGSGGIRGREDGRANAEPDAWCDLVGDRRVVAEEPAAPRQQEVGALVVVDSVAGAERCDAVRRRVHRAEAELAHACLQGRVEAKGLERHPVAGRRMRQSEDAHAVRAIRRRERLRGAEREHVQAVARAKAHEREGLDIDPRERRDVGPQHQACRRAEEVATEHRRRRSVEPVLLAEIDRRREDERIASEHGGRREPHRLDRVVCCRDTRHEQERRNERAAQGKTLQLLVFFRRFAGGTAP